MDVRGRIAIADDDQIVRDFLRVSLEKLGYEIVVNASSAAALISGCSSHHPDLVITDIEMPGPDGLTALEESGISSETPVIILSSHHDEQLVERVAESSALAYLVKPIDFEDLRATIPLAIKRFEEIQSYRSDVASLRQDLANRKIVEKAKGVIMTKLSMNESVAFRHLQKLARDNRKQLVDIANSILLAEEALTVK